ncbi:MAG: DUF1554 domain-containing protein [Chloroflexota bacterium]|nr:DUF1554 domain-containing protein [Chloroflexota bacterium]
MDNLRFDTFTQHVSARLSRRTGLGMLAGVSLPLHGLREATDAKKKKKVTLCVDSQTVKAPKKKAKKLLKQGATKGACAEGCPGGQKACGSGCIPVGDCCVADDCTGTDRCENGTCVALTCGNGGACTVFQTSDDSFTGGLIGGLAGGDAKCQAAADAANLDGTFKAWLSFELNTPETRFTNVDNAGPYRLVANGSDGNNLPPKVADNFADLFTCGGGACLDNAISRDENGDTPPTPQLVWTGTEANGAAAADTCSGWTSSAAGVKGLGGTNSATTELWTDSGVTTDCSFEGRLYCFQQAT